jgi:hypothetical protein
VIDAREDAGLRCRDFEIDLVGLEFDERIAGRDLIAWFFQPLRHARVDDRLAYFRNDDVYRHVNDR